MAKESGFAQGTPIAPGISCSAGVMAYNEAGNIASAIASILNQPLETGCIAEVIVVASGCTDDTVPIVRGICQRDPRVRLIVQERREGKASAINLFLSAATAPILLMVSADVIIKDGSLDALLRPFGDPRIGMVGAHPIPVNDEQRFLGHAVHLLWSLHDRIARQSPKLGEVVAFRNVVPSIPPDTPVDEISIQALVVQLGYELLYEPRAIVYNRGPETIGDFLRQRRRIYSGHLRIQRQQQYSAATMSVPRITRALLAEHPFATPRAACWTCGTVGLEALARALGSYDQMRRRQHQVWQMAGTTKARIAEAATAHSLESVLVFHIAGFHQHELELGSRNARRLLEAVTERLRQELRAYNGNVAAERNGTIIAQLPVDRAEAERLAQQVIPAVARAPLRIAGSRETAPVRLACGIIEFAREGGGSSAFATSVPESAWSAQEQSPAVEAV
ncbi:MAG: hypothetical protein OJF49_002553 [Ktedonobacterales bacterium]|jgi:hypothetical protein|nr:MAG: hypothetical protein OJF49_002553 [Ktedonobacterales bacterium]